MAPGPISCVVAKICCPLDYPGADSARAQRAFLRHRHERDGVLQQIDRFQYRIVLEQDPESELNWVDRLIVGTCFGRGRPDVFLRRARPV